MSQSANQTHEKQRDRDLWQQGYDAAMAEVRRYDTICPQCGTNVQLLPRTDDAAERELSAEQLVGFAPRGT